MIERGVWKRRNKELEIGYCRDRDQRNQGRRDTYMYMYLLMTYLNDLFTRQNCAYNTMYMYVLYINTCICTYMYTVYMYAN